MVQILDKSFFRCEKSEIILGQYEDCSFVECDFSGEKWANYKFIDCKFKDCKLSLIQVTNTSFQSVKFDGCKIMGVLFEKRVWFHPVGIEWFCQKGVRVFFRFRE